MLALTLGTDDLTVAPAAPQGWTFAAGDRLIGTVVRRAPIVSPEAIVTLALRGGLKIMLANQSSTRLVSSDGPRPAGFCAVNRQLLIPKPIELFQGSLDLAEPSEPLSWPFEIEIPSMPDEPTHSKEMALSPYHEALIRGPLPASFITTGYGAFASCWIEYYLEATLHYTYGGKRESCTSTHTIKIRPPAFRKFSSFGTQVSNIESSVRSFHLLPGKENSGLSLLQKKRAFFGSSKVPQFDYKLEITAPERIQLNNTTPIPIKLKCFRLEDADTTDQKDFTPKIWLTAAKMSIRSKTDVYRDDSPPDLPHGSRESSHDLGLDWAMESNDPQGFKLEIPMGEKSEPLDIGETLQLSLHENGLKAGTKHLKPTLLISPDFDAIYIKHSNRLEMEFLVTVAGLTERMIWWGDVTLL
ncbi:hypothetical protein N7532_007324 [Penicillium argentinense]|uniref:Arrestin-like N-terminal domain-containing protein n=1 Tax=Penicillium argentinense TaxID=1131581 RepID=A0A9W9F7J6_9EURO|nr:uncharacterized protein N7532_007324 [Penicillium argentinense]KAJ5095033.1 hypothetical protein N7532_007324 [Penicillium argentinense]